MSEIHFGYEPMFEINTPHNPSDSELNRLSEFMTTERNKIPAGYTYLGQFIDHDIALDSEAGTPPWGTIPSSNTSNKRTPFLDLETIYGFEGPYEGDRPTRAQLLKENSNTLLKLGDTKPTPIVNRIFVGKDLPRMPDSPKALIVDSRNDDNLAVAQTQVAFMRFHNAVVKHLNLDDSTATFETARRIVIQHYQWIILKDYLPRILKTSVLNDVLTEGPQFYFPNPKTPFMPLEFSVAAFRLGHSMIRDRYNWNLLFNDDPFTDAQPATLCELTKFTGRGGLGGRKQLVSDWLINWNWFYDISINEQHQKFNLAFAIDTKVAHGLRSVIDPCNVPSTFSRETSLPAFDLYRARALGLPTGQAVAKIILGTKERILKPEQIANLLPADLKYVFSKHTPLWFYLLAEAEIEEQGQTLGDVGSRIIAETLVELIRHSKPSILNDDFQPNTDFCDSKGEFGMAPMLKFVRSIEDYQGFDQLNPLENVDLCDK